MGVVLEIGMQWDVWERSLRNVIWMVLIYVLIKKCGNIYNVI